MRSVMVFKRLFLASLCAGSAITAGGAGYPPERMVYNPITQQSEPEQRGAQAAAALAVSGAFEGEASLSSPEPTVVQAGHVAGADSCGSCGDGSCDGVACGGAVGCGTGVVGGGCEIVGCGDATCGDVASGGCATSATFYTGIEFTFLKPHYDDNVAFTMLDGSATGDSAFTDVEFDHDTEFTPRVYLGWRHRDGVGLRVTWWAFDHEAQSASASPDADGFGQISHPPFSGVDISSVIPTDVFTAGSHLEAYAIDIETTQEACLGGWDVVVAGGVRYADVEQGYRAQLQNAAGDQRGTIDYRQGIDGIGPTISLGASRPLGRLTTLFCKARGSVLFGDGESFLSAAENLDAPPEVATTRTSSRDDLLSIGEVQVGFQWQGRRRRMMPYRPFASVALEGQVWNGAGSATSEDGSLGFFGVNTGIGLAW